MKKLSIFKLEKILFFLSGQVVQLSRYTFFGFVDLNGLGQGHKPQKTIFLPKIKIGSFNSKFSETSKYQIFKKYFFLTKVTKKFLSPGFNWLGQGGESVKNSTKKV